MPLIILDRDGVINQDSDAFIKSPAEFVPIPGSLAAIARLKRAGYTVMVASNQSGIARGLLDWPALEAIHARLAQLLQAKGTQLDGIVVCPHGPADQCDCRKPRPGLYLQIARQLHQSLDGVPVIGDSLRDIQAAQAVGAHPILVLTGKGERTLERGEGLEGVPVYADLAEAVEALLIQPSIL